MTKEQFEEVAEDELDNIFDVVVEDEKCTEAP